MDQFRGKTDGQFPPETWGRENNHEEIFFILVLSTSKPLQTKLRGAFWPPLGPASCSPTVANLRPPWEKAKQAAAVA